MFREKFWGTLVLSIPTIIWAPMIQHWFGYHAPGGPGASAWIPAIFGSLVFAYGGWVFLEGAIGEIRDGLPGMMTLISLAISVAFVFSLAVTLGFPGSDLWWELATLVTIMVLGPWIEMRSISQAQGALKELAKLLPDSAVRLVGERIETVPVSDLRNSCRGRVGAVGNRAARCCRSGADVAQHHHRRDQRATPSPCPIVTVWDTRSPDQSLPSVTASSRTSRGP